MPLYLTHPDPRTIALLRNLAEALHCEVREIPEADPEAEARVDAYLAEHETQRTARKLDAVPDDTALALARRLAPGLKWEALNDDLIEARISDGIARLHRGHNQACLTVFPGASGWRWFDGDPVSPDLLDSVRAHLASRCRFYIFEHRGAFTRASAIASRVRGVEALLAGLEATTVPAEIRR